MQLVVRCRALRDPAREHGRERADGAQRRVRRVRVAVRVRERISRYPSYKYCRALPARARPRACDCARNRDRARSRPARAKTEPRDARANRARAQSSIECAATATGALYWLSETSVGLSSRSSGRVAGFGT